MKVRLAALAACLLAACSAAAAERRKLCNSIELTGDEVVKFSEVEEKLVCGDAEREGWTRVPASQARYFLRSFLQQRGYHLPRFSERNGVLEVELGPKTRITGIEATGLAPSVRLSRHRGVIGSLLTPKALDELKGWIVTRLKDEGYGCPGVELSADARTGLVTVEVKPGPIHLIDRIRYDATTQMDLRVIERYEAFERPQRLDLRLLTLTSTRIMAQDLFLSAYYDLACSSSAALSIVQRLTPAPPRLITIGVGMDSEGYARARGRWRHSRIGRSASNIESTLFASYREQSLEGLSRIYFSPAFRAHLMPRLQARRENETTYETYYAQAALLPSYAWDNEGLHIETRVGPALEYVDTRRGAGPPGENFLTFNTETQFMGHLFEYFLRDPRTGWQARLQTSSRLQGANSSFTGHQLQASGERLWNLGNYDPPSLILGWRGTAGTTVGQKQLRVPGVLPTTMRFFLGGDANLRGFRRKEIPPDATGLVTALYQGLELRGTGLLPRNLQPLIFIDWAMAGNRDAYIQPDMYWSPGIGLRWGSPVGSLRFTFGRALTWRRDPNTIPIRPHWQFFFSFGREF